MDIESAVISIHKLNYIYLAINKCFVDDWEKMVQLGGLTYPQSKLLIILRESGQSTMSKLAEKGFWHMSTVTELVNRMEKEGLVKKHIDEIDKRVVKVDITEKGNLMLDNTKEIYYKNSDIFKAILNLDKRELDNAFEIFTKICKTTKGIEGPCVLSTAMKNIEHPKCNCSEIAKRVHEE